MPQGQVPHSPDVLKGKGLRLLGKGARQVCLGGLNHRGMSGLQPSLQLALVFPESSVGLRSLCPEVVRAGCPELLGASWFSREQSTQTCWRGVGDGNRGGKSFHSSCPSPSVSFGLIQDGVFPLGLVLDLPSSHP